MLIFKVTLAAVDVLKDGVTTPRHYSDYDISIDKDMPEGVTLIEKL